MANQIRIHTSCEIVNDNSVANEGSAAGDYTHLALDVHADSRSWGGNYNIAQAYDSATPAVCYWKNAVMADTNPTIDYLDNSGWTTSSDVTDGAIPTTAHVVAVEYVKTLGTVTHIDVTLSGEVIARLTLGESIVIPWHVGEVVGSIGLTPSHAYSAGVNEATVNVMLAGV